MNSPRDLVGIGGRGTSSGDSAARPPMDVRAILVDSIDPDPEQPRKTFDEVKLDELAASIRESGLLQPIRVRPDVARPGRYFIVAGERRWRAAKRVPMLSIAAIVTDQRHRDERTRVEQVVENLQREEPNAVEAGESYRTLLEIFRCSQSDLARRLGVSTSHVSRMLAVAELDEETRRRIVTGELNYMDALRERDRRAAAADPKSAPRSRRRPAVPRGTIPTPFGVVKLKRGKTLAELVGYLQSVVDQEKRDAA